MRLPTTHRWLFAVGGSSLLLLLSSLAVKQHRAGRGATPSLARLTSCEVPHELSVRVMPEADTAPVILYGKGPVRMFVDGAPAAGSPQEPLRLAPGEHTLRVEASGHQPLTTGFRVHAYSPALFHAQVDPHAGLTLVRLGAHCATCPPPLKELEFKRAPSTEPTSRLYARAAEALRHDDWPQALRALEEVEAKERSRPMFRRLAAGVFGATGQFSSARKQLAAIRPEDANELSALLRAMSELEKAEQARHQEVLWKRWNRTVERFSELNHKFEPVAPTTLAEASRRLGDLSRAFDQAATRADRYDQDQVLRAAESTLLDVVETLVASRPEDCALLKDVLRVATRS